MDPTDPSDPLADLRDRLRATQEAAARLAGGGAEVPPQGWASPGSGAASGGGGGAGAEGARPDPGLGDELQQLVAVIASLRELVPPELQQQVTDLVRQVLVLVRAILDWWIERLEPSRGGEPDVEDIPIS
jgi:hypothetical protein